MAIQNVYSRFSPGKIDCIVKCPSRNSSKKPFFDGKFYSGKKSYFFRGWEMGVEGDDSLTSAGSGVGRGR